MKYAIVGKGFIYPRHVKSINETGGEVVMTCDIDHSKNPDFVDWREMFASDEFKDVDTVVICTPNDTHKSIAQEALKLGKIVLCEKPLSIDGTDGLDGVNTVLQLRYHLEVNKAKGLKPKRVDIVLKMKRGPDYWNGWKGKKQRSGGLIYNLGIHYADLLIYLLGDFVEVLEPDNPRVFGDNLHTFSFEARFANGIGSLHIEADEDLIPQRTLTYEADTIGEINLSTQENLSSEGLHTEVYKKLLQGEGIPLSEARKSLEMVAELCRLNERY